MSGVRPWQLIVWRQGLAPMISLGLHLDLHTPTLDLHTPFGVIQLGRNGFWTRTNRLNGMRFVFGDRVMIGSPMPWSGHTDNCDHARATDPEAGGEG